ncbi:MAG: helix-turn-helix domain-containing protein [Candidatus Acidiferrales bacterium]
MASTSSFGEHLRREREMRGVSLEELSSATRINTRFLTAIENGHWEELPGGAFNRGFIRSTARYLGLDEDGMVAEYSLETRNGIQPIVPRPAVRKSRAWQRMTIIVAAVLALVVAGWFATSRIVHRLPARSQTAEPAAKAGDSVNARAVAVALTLVVRAANPAQLSVRADGKQVFEGQIQTGDQKAFKAATIFGISTNDAAAVRLELNGQPIAPMGLAKQPGSITLTAKDLKSSAGGRH